MDKDKVFPSISKNVKFGKYELKIITYYLTGHEWGLRIDVRKFSMARFKKNTTVEVELLHGDDVLLLKQSHIMKVLESPTKKELDAVIDEFIKYSEEKGWV